MEESGFNKRTFGGKLIAGDLRGAVDYLNSFPENERRYRYYVSRFEKGKLAKRTDNERINALDQIYQRYYIDVFWKQTEAAQAEKKLASELAAFLGADEEMSIDTAEELACALVEKEGFSFLGGRTSGVYGPYIWQSTERIMYEIELPDGVFVLPVNMMNGFVSRSWLDFLSFGKIGTGGWVSGTKQELFCVRKVYKKDLDRPSFRLSYLKHEAQHAHDHEMFGEMASVDLEYRAKLVELIYWPTTHRFVDFVYEANGNNKSNSHSYASYCLVSEISRRVLGTDAQYNTEIWKGKNKKIKAAALEMLREHGEKAKKTRAETDGVITVL